MLKKGVFALAMCAVLLTILAGSAVFGSAAGAESEVDPVTYADGVYEGRGEGYNDFIEVEVTIADGVIADIAVTYIEDTAGIWEVAVDTVKPQILQSQSTQVDTVSQATASSQGYIDAVQDALDKAQASASVPPAVDAAYVDGVYEGRGEGYMDFIDVEVTIADGAIADIKVTYIEDTPGIWEIAVNTITPKILETQSTEVDTVSQATVSSRGFIDAVDDALTKAEASEPDDSAVLNDGVFSGRGEGYMDFIEVEVTIADGTITAIEVTYVEDTPGIWDLAVDILTSKILETQSVDVDTVSQATVSSQGFLDAVQDALQKAAE